MLIVWQANYYQTLTLESQNHYTSRINNLTDNYKFKPQEMMSSIIFLQGFLMLYVVTITEYMLMFSDLYFNLLQCFPTFKKLKVGDPLNY